MTRSISIVVISFLIAFMLCLWLRKPADRIQSVDGLPLVSDSHQGTRVDVDACKWEVITEQRAVLTNNALPALKSFLHSLAGVGLSPIDPNLGTNRVVPVEMGSNKYVLTSKLLIDNKWVASFDDIPDTELTSRFVGITEFGQTGPDNPYTAVTDGDTNRLARMAHPNPMSMDTAAGILQRGLAAVLREPVPPAAVNLQRFYGYDLNRWKGRWWKPGEDRWNQLNIDYELVIQPLSATQGIVVLFRNDVAGTKRPL
jgi:hypothetical protein